VGLTVLAADVPHAVTTRATTIRPGKRDTAVFKCFARKVLI
jgi:hypothetical protein